MRIGYYTHLSLDERELLTIGLAQELSLRGIAQQLGRSPSTLSRELRRNGRGARSHYRPSRAHRLAQARSRLPRRPRRLTEKRLRKYVRWALSRNWSPDQIAQRLHREYPEDMSQRISHETIYKELYLRPRGHLKEELKSCLRRQHKYRYPRKGDKERRGRIPNMISIHDRPAEIDDRQVPGHWEGDLIVCKASSAAIGTLVERVTRLVIMVKMEDSTAETAQRNFARKLRRIPADLRRSLTYDRGREMSQHEKLAQSIGIKVYFTDPHSPWQRGLNENTNGLIRQYYPKGTDLTPVTQRDLNRVAELLNTRPRKTLGYQTPLEAYEELARVALGS